MGTIFTDPSRPPGWLWPLVLAWLTTLSIAIAAAWLVFGTVDAVVRQHAPGAPTAVAPQGEAGEAARRADQR